LENASSGAFSFGHDAFRHTARQTTSKEKRRTYREGKENKMEQRTIPLTPDALELYVTVANIAGFLETDDKIHIPDDNVLAETCIMIVDKYDKHCEQAMRTEGAFPEAFAEFAEDWLFEKHRLF
jgi:hypothetical protein